MSEDKVTPAKNMQAPNLSAPQDAKRVELIDAYFDIVENGNPMGDPKEIADLSLKVKNLLKEVESYDRSNDKELTSVYVCLHLWDSLCATSYALYALDIPTAHQNLAKAKEWIAAFKQHVDTSQFGVTAEIIEDVFPTLQSSVDGMAAFLRGDIATSTSHLMGEVERLKNKDSIKNADLSRILEAKAQFAKGIFMAREGIDNVSAGQLIHNAVSQFRHIAAHAKHITKQEKKFYLGNAYLCKASFEFEVNFKRLQLLDYDYFLEGGQHITESAEYTIKHLKSIAASKNSLSTDASLSCIAATFFCRFYKFAIRFSELAIEVANGKQLDRQTITELHSLIHEARTVVEQQGKLTARYAALCDQLVTLTENLHKLAAPSKKDFGRFSGFVTLCSFMLAVSIIVILDSISPAQIELTPAMLGALLIISLICGFGVGAIKFRSLIASLHGATSDQQK